MVKNKSITSFFKRKDEVVDGRFDENQKSKRQKGSSSTSEPVIEPNQNNQQDNDIPQNPQANVNEVDVSRLERDPAKRLEMWKYPVNIREQVRLAYLKLGAYQIKLDEYKPGGPKNNLRRFKYVWFGMFPNWLEYSPTTHKASPESLTRTYYPKHSAKKKNLDPDPPSEKFKLRHCLQTLSSQQLMDCIPPLNPCGSLLPLLAFKYVIRNGGIALDRDYPVVDRFPFGRCRADEVEGGHGTIEGYGFLPIDDVMSMKKVVAKHPVAAVLQATDDFKHFRGSGVYRTPFLVKKLNHYVTIVGYSKTTMGEEYWIVRCSWGESFGDKGYVKIKMWMTEEPGVSCGVTWVQYPILQGVNPPDLDAPIQPLFGVIRCECEICAPSGGCNQEDLRGDVKQQMDVVLPAKALGVDCNMKKVFGEVNSKVGSMGFLIIK